MDEPGNNVPQNNTPPARPALLRNPAQFIAFGFGSGLFPVAPGTAGTLAAIPLYLLVADWSLLYYSAFVVVAALFGIWICGVASRQLGVHDHSGIVWDEFVGLWIALWAVPKEWIWILSACVVFRVFDIVKPWPISAIDRRVGGGFGIMADDIVAGLMTCLTLHIALWLL
tara:strand:+ start:27719 stop:28228 length:510 start_codon:yes stop_codon:yes gene_type:complete